MSESGLSLKSVDVQQSAETVCDGEDERDWAVFIDFHWPLQGESTASLLLFFFLFSNVSVGLERGATRSSPDDQALCR